MNYHFPETTMLGIPEDRPTPSPNQILIKGIDLKGYQLETVDSAVVTQLAQNQTPQLQELGIFFQKNQHYGTGTEYDARLVRAQEAVGMAPKIDLDSREKFEWGPGEVIELEDFIPMIHDGEEIQIVDYKGREYQLLKEGNEFRVLGAYQNDKPMKYNITGETVENLEGNYVAIWRYETNLDDKARENGIDPAYIRLVEQGIETQKSKYGDEIYTEKKGNRNIEVSASRLLMSFQGRGFGVLVSHLKLIPHDQHERERVDAAFWRIQDSISTIRDMVKPVQTPDGAAISNRPIPFETFVMGDLFFDTEGGVHFSIKDANHTHMIEYDFGINGNSAKEYIKAGSNWISPLQNDAEPDGLKHIHTLQAATLLDNFRYALQKATTPSSHQRQV